MTGTAQLLRFLLNTGTNGTHILKKNWSATTLGRPESWPDELKITLGVVLSSTYPKIFCWGRELVCFFNKAYADEIIGGADDSILGKPLSVALPDLWRRINDSIGNFFDAHSNLRMEVKPTSEPENGEAPDVMYILNPVFDANGKVIGIVITVRAQPGNKTEEVAASSSDDFFFKKAVDDAHFGIVQLMGSNHIVRYGNDRFFSDYLSADAASVIGKPLFEVMDYNANPSFRSELDIAFRSGISIQKSADNSLKFKDGDFYFDYDIIPIRNDLAEVVGLMITIYDVTDRVQSRVNEKADHQRLQMALDAGGLALWEVDLQSMVVQSSQKLFKMFGISDHQLTADAMRKSVHPDDLNRVITGFRQAMRTGDYFGEFRVVKKEGRITWVRVRGKVFYTDDGSAYKIVGTSRDITKEKKHELELRRKESRLRHLILEAPVAIGILRGAGLQS